MDKLIEVQFVIINQFGEYTSELMNINEEQYDVVIEKAKDFYNTGFELNCEDGSYMVFSPDITRYSILKIKRNIKDE